MEALDLNDFVQRVLGRGAARHARGDLAGARSCYQEALRSRPDHPYALNLLGLVEYESGRYGAARMLASRAVAQRADDPDLHYNLGNACSADGAPSEALAAYRRSVELRPDFAPGWYNFANTLCELGRVAEAEEPYRRACELDPALAAAWFNLGNVQRQLARHAAAESAYRRALELKPDHVMAQCGLGRTLLAQHDPVRALECLQRALSLDAACAEAYVGLGELLKEAGRYADAVRSLDRAVALEPARIEGLEQRAFVLAAQGRIEEALESYEKAASIADRAYPQQCRLAFAQLYSDTRPPDVLFDTHRAAGEILEKSVNPAPARPATRSRAGKVRIGYVSADFRRHSVAYFIEHVLTAHDRSRFDVWCYASQEKYDAVSERIRSSVDGWVDAGRLADEELSARITEDGIDLLIDLSGHTAGNRLPVFARHPARVQATWLGYPTTTGLRAIDFRVSDWVVDPQGSDRLSSERVLRMPASYFCYGAPPGSPDPGPPPTLATGVITFGSFNNLAKLSGATMRLWARVLEAVPGSRLLVKSKALVDEHTRDDLRDRFERLGVRTDRLELRGWMEETSAHLAAYNEVDIALDSFPYNGATTTCEALWMGVPVLTLAGESHAARAGSSILRAAGRDDWVASRTGEFVDKAVALAGDPALLSRYRAELRARLRASALMNVEQFDRALEEHYLQMLARDSVQAP